MTALNEWPEKAAIEEGAVLCQVDRHSNVLGARLSGEAVSLIIKECFAVVGLPVEDYSGHSLRAGLATSAASASVSSWKIRQQSNPILDVVIDDEIQFLRSESIVPCQDTVDLINDGLLRLAGTPKTLIGLMPLYDSLKTF